MGIVQLDPPLWLETPLGPGWAHIYRDDGPGADTFWTVFLKGGAIVVFRNDQVRAGNSYTGGRWNPGVGAALRRSDDTADCDMRRIVGTEP